MTTQDYITAIKWTIIATLVLTPVMWMFAVRLLIAFRLPLWGGDYGAY